MAHLGHAVMSDLSPLSGEERKLDFGAARSAFDPKPTPQASATPSTVCAKLRDHRGLHATRENDQPFHRAGS
jgi:hypothetical protein